MDVIRLTKTDVTVVKFIKEFIFVGIGGTLSKYDLNGRILSSMEVFGGQKIYGVIPNTSDCLFIYGGTKMKILSLKDEIDHSSCHLHDDWILEAKWINNERDIAIVSMKNFVSIYSITNMKLIRNVRCIEKCILYSACLCYDTSHALVVLCGTVFGEVLILQPTKIEEKEYSTVLHRIQGHNGVIFSVSYCEKLGIICTTSDDRSVRIWKVKHRDLHLELQQDNISIESQHVLYGHTSRVWKNKILNNHILTAGEDSQVFVWNLDGTVYRHFETHQGGCVWSFDCLEEKNLILTGGSDCGVALHSLHRQGSKSVLPLANNEIPKHVSILQSGNLCVFTENGVLLLYLLTEEKWVQVEHFEDLKSYSLLEISSCRNLIALAGFQGNIYAFKENRSKNNLIRICTLIIPEKSRIFSLHWLSCKDILTCGPDGVLSLWKMNYEQNDRSQTSLQFVTNFYLPPCKERWSTTACFCSENCIVVGDRKGNLHLFDLHHSEAVCHQWKAHNYLGVSKIISGSDHVISLGRNSTLNEYKFNSESKTLTLMSKDKLPFKWLANYYQDQQETLVLGFSGDSFILWDQTNRRTLLEISCGGGHRSWNFRKLASSLSFTYVKDKAIHVSNYDWHALKSVEIVEGFHTKETNSCKIVRLGREEGFLVVSGSEDTTMRLSCAELSGKSFDFWNFQILKSHLSSIRAIFVLDFRIIASTQTSKCKEYLIVSAGGRAQLILWKLRVSFTDQSVSDISSEELCNFYESSNEDYVEIRIMSVTCAFFEKENFVLLVAACSDGKLKFYKISITARCEINYVGCLLHEIKCILNVSYIKVQSRTVLISMGTDGNLVFWDISAIIDALKENEKCLDSFFKTIPFSIIKCHQSGINSFNCKEISCKENNWLFVTGGDDNKVNVSVVTFKLRENVLEKTQLRAAYENSIAHCAQITGILLLEKYFMTTSIDQKLQLFSWNLDNSFNLEVKCVNTYYTSVPDIKGLELMSENIEEIVVFVFGCGFDICRIKYFT